MFRWFRNKKPTELKILKSKRNAARDLRRRAKLFPNFPLKQSLSLSKAAKQQHLGQLRAHRKDLVRQQEELEIEKNRLFEDCKSRDEMILKRKEQEKKIQGEMNMLASANENDEEIIIIHKTRMTEIEKEMNAVDGEIELGQEIVEADDSLLHFPAMGMPAVHEHFQIFTPEDIDGISLRETQDIFRDFDTHGMPERQDYEGPETYEFSNHGTQDINVRKSIISKALKIMWMPKSKKTAATEQPTASDTENTTSAAATTKKRSWDDLTTEKDSDEDQFKDKEEYDRLTASLLDSKVHKKRKTGGY